MSKINSILLVDDDQINNFINRRIIKKLNIAEEVNVALNGEEALNYIQTFCDQTGHCPELILLDINMPVMNGFEFLNEFSHLQMKNKSNVKIIVLTTSTNPSDLQKLKEFSVKGFVNKPLTEKKILELINQEG
ncbi:MAG: response regulator [Cytophagaceae bacterium]|nr:response regulator [Cytophagaceae bacterium]